MAASSRDKKFSFELFTLMTDKKTPTGLALMADTSPHAKKDPHDLINSGLLGLAINYTATDGYVSCTEFCGRRPTQQDRASVRKKLSDETKKLSDDGWGRSFKNAGSVMNSKVEELTKADPSLQYAGSCLIAVVKVGDKLHIYNVGDSTAFVAVIDANGATKIYPLNTLHHPSDPSETQRIRQAGGKVSDNGRLQGRLAVSRAFGDIFFDQVGLSHEGDVTHFQVPIPIGGKAFLFEACDGVTEIEETFPKIAGIFSRNKDKGTKLMSQELLLQAYADGSEDNLTGIVAPIDPDNTEPELFVIYDGHGLDQNKGHIIAEFLYQEFPAELEKQAKLQYKQECYEKKTTPRVTAETPWVSAPAGERQGLYDLLARKDEQIKVLEEEVKELFALVEQQKAQIKALQAKTATKPSSSQSQTTATSPVFFQPITSSIYKHDCPGLIGIKMNVAELGTNNETVYAITLVFSDKKVPDFSKLFEGTELHVRSTKKTGSDTFDARPMEIFDGKDQCYVAIDFRLNSSLYFESLDSKDKYKGYILLRELEKIIDITSALQFYYNDDDGKSLTEDQLPTSLQTAAFAKETVSYLAKKSQSRR